MTVKAFSVDLNKPLVFQVGHLGDTYQEWVHQPIVSKEGPRFFESNFWEFLTRTAWWVIPLVWLPVVSFTVLISIKRGLSPGQAVCVTLCGIFVWTLMEYSLHRFLFHIKTSSYWGNTLHYLLHGCHHKHPMDGYRLVFPPAATAILLIPESEHTNYQHYKKNNNSFIKSKFWFLVKMLTPYVAAPAVLGGGLLGYVMYDVTHYYLHHGKPSQKLARGLKTYHLNHHFKIQTSGFGITSSLWDWVFDTLPPKKA